TGAWRVAATEPAELLEDVVLFVRRYARAGIGDFDKRPGDRVSEQFCRLSTQAHEHRTMLSILKRVGQQVAGDLPDPGPVGFEDCRGVPHVHGERKSSRLRRGVVLLSQRA